MGRFRRHIAAAMVLQAVCAVATLAADQVVEKPVTADTAENFAHTAVQIRKEMNGGGRYEFIGPEDRGKANADLDALAAMLQKSGPVVTMPPAEQAKLFNIQEHLNGILTRVDGNHLICGRGLPTGSNIPVRMCKTVAEIMKARRDSQKLLRDQRQGDLNTHTGS
jgi:hypothetical protein